MRPTDKHAHGFIALYAGIIANHPIRDVLEVGVASGGGLDFFRANVAGRVVGVDINLPGPADGIELHQLDQRDPAIAGLGDFDLVVDDASHFAAHTARTLELLWPRTRVVYVIEDWSVGYWPGLPYGDTSGVVANILARNEIKAAAIDIHHDGEMSYAASWKAGRGLR